MAENYNGVGLPVTANSPLGHNLWQLINSPDALRAVEVASDLGYPAIAGIEEALLTTFSTALRGTVALFVKPHEVREEIKKRGYARKRLERIMCAASNPQRQRKPREQVS
jgi:hypothetical protein